MKNLNIVKASKRIVDYLKLNGLPVSNVDRKIIMGILKEVGMESEK